jgi:hypothetical protein
MKYARVKWADSRVIFAEHSQEEIDELELAVMETAGHLVRNSDEVLVIAQDMVQHPGEPVAWRNQIVIANFAVISIEFLEPVQFEGGPRVND